VASDEVVGLATDGGAALVAAEKVAPRLAVGTILPLAAVGAVGRDGGAPWPEIPLFNLSTSEL
jgi:hypothetical protein